MKLVEPKLLTQLHCRCIQMMHLFRYRLTWPGSQGVEGSYLNKYLLSRYIGSKLGRGDWGAQASLWEFTTLSIWAFQTSLPPGFKLPDTCSHTCPRRCQVPFGYWEFPVIPLGRDLMLCSPTILMVVSPPLGRVRAATSHSWTKVAPRVIENKVDFSSDVLDAKGVRVYLE